MLLFGGSGHAKVVLDCLAANQIPVLGIFDDNPALNQLLHFPVVGPYRPDFFPMEPLLLTIGNNHIRKKLALTVQHRFGKIMHPSAIVSSYAFIGEGTVVFQNSVVQASATVGKHCIINTAASVDHDCILEDFVHISPNATLSGNVRIGEGTHVGASATVIQGIIIGKWCTIGAGAVVTKDIPDFATAVGVPAKVIKIKPL